MKIAAVGVLACVLVVAGCGSGGDDAATTTPAAASTSVSPQTTAPTEPPTTAVASPTDSTGDKLAAWWATAQPAYDKVIADAQAATPSGGAEVLVACSTLKDDLPALQAALGTIPYDPELGSAMTNMHDQYSAAAATCLYVPDEAQRQTVFTTANAQAATVRTLLTARGLTPAA